jgi:hypothetical protein
MNDIDQAEKFSDDPEEQLRIENEILRMKVAAEYGAQFGGSENLPPEVENEFLKNVLAFEQHYEEGKGKSEKLIELLGNPVFSKECELDDEKFEAAYKNLQNLLEEKSISVDFIKERDDRFKYKFITEELFEHDTGCFLMPGMVMHYTYEEFHPDHEMDIGNCAKDFLEGWFEQSIDEESFYLGHHFIQADGRALTKAELVKKIKNVFAACPSFENCRYKIFEVKYQLHEQEELSGMGHAEGAVKYDVVLENGERKNIEGPFKLYMSLKYGCWRIFYFHLPGFNA